MERGDVDACSIGTRIVLPSSFTGGRRYMFNNCQDAMFICKQYGYPDLFITITCNPSWLEFQRYTEQSHIAISDRLDLACRLFELKIQSLMTDLKDAVFFGPVNADQLREEHDVNLDKLTDEQKLIYERIIDTVANNSFLCMDLVELEKHFCGDCCLPVFDQNRELF
ncbi:hypothetical protein AHAS_Ahas17G0175800 [Arachis hypogaea]